MSTIENYKTLMDNSNRGELRSIIKQIETAPDIPYVDRQRLLGYGYYKMDFLKTPSNVQKISLPITVSTI